MRMRVIKGSLTVEAALILPLLLFLFAMVLDCGIWMYTECCGTAVSIYEEQDLETVKTFYFWQRIGDMTEDGDSLY